MDRMEIIRIAGYTETKRPKIARKHLIPHAVTKHGLDAKEWSIDEDALKTLIRRYTARPACAISSAKSRRSAAKR